MKIESETFVTLLAQTSQLSTVSIHTYTDIMHTWYQLGIYLNLVQSYLFVFESNMMPKNAMTRAKSCSSLFDHLHSKCIMLYIHTYRERDASPTLKVLLTYFWASSALFCSFLLHTSASFSLFTLSYHTWELVLYKRSVN